MVIFVRLKYENNFRLTIPAPPNAVVVQKTHMVDIEHYYVEQGSGFPLILLHGNGEDVSYFEHQMEPFSEHFRVIAIDTRGHGKTPRGEAPFTIRQFADDLLSFMDAHGRKRSCWA